MRLNVKNVTSENDLQIQVESFYSGLDIKKHIEFLYDIPWKNQALTYESASLGNDDKISNYDIHDGDTISLAEEERRLSFRCSL